MLTFLRIALSIVLVGALAPPVAAHAAKRDKRARAAVSAKLAKYDRVERLSCKRVRGTRGLRHKCAWRAQRRPTPNLLVRCRGMTRTRAGRRRVRTRPGARTRCSHRIDTLAPWLGFNDNAVRARQVGAADDARLTESMGAGITRLGFDWRHAEPRPGEFQLEDYDRIYAESLKRGVRPLFVLAFAPGWARDSLLCLTDCRYPPAPRYYWAWQRIASLVAGRYPRAAGIEIWNEPNEAEFWTPGPDPRVYTELLTTAHAAIKRANPAMPVVTGGFSNRRHDQWPNIGLANFIQGVYASGGRGSFDALGFHAYPESPRFEAIPHTLRAVTEIPALHDDPHVPLWATETGLSTTDPEPRYRVTDREQADGLVGTVRRLRQAGVSVVLVHTLVDATAGGERERGYGVFRTDLSPKPAVCALAREVGVRVAPGRCGG